jgi:hypothetical protein
MNVYQQKMDSLLIKVKAATLNSTAIFYISIMYLQVIGRYSAHWQMPYLSENIFL